MIYGKPDSPPHWSLWPENQRLYETSAAHRRLFDEWDGKPAPARTSCVYFGAPALDADGDQKLTPCLTCPGEVRLKVFQCGHPGHSADPTTTIPRCESCADHAERLGDPEMNFWRGGS